MKFSELGLAKRISDDLETLGFIEPTEIQEKTIPSRYFLLLAWLPVMTMGYILMVGSWTGLAIVLGGGLCYTGGLWFLINDDKHPYFHAVWHMSTITGAALHFLFTFWYVATPTIG